MSKTNPGFLSPPFDNTVTPGTVTGVAVATGSRTNERAHSANATTTNSSLSINSFFKSPALPVPVQQNNNERTTTNDVGEHKEIVDNL